MTVFVDASALIAMIANEPDALTLAETLQSDPAQLCSAIAASEATAELCRSYAVPYDIASEQVRLILKTLGIQLVTIGPKELDFATAAYARFGKGRHPAKLNMGDCFAYACAKACDAKLLFKGNDFAQTDITPAV